MSVSKTIKSIVLFTPSAHGFYFGALCEHLRLLCFELNLHLHTQCISQSDPVDELVALQSADGVIVLHRALSPTQVQTIQKKQLPLVSLRYQYPQLAVDTVLNNNRDGIVQAFNHLYELGHRDIVFVGAPFDQNMVERAQAFMECRQAYGLPNNPNNYVTVNSQSFRGGHDAAEKIIHMNPMPTAVLCGNDLQAIGLDKRLRQHGWYCPDQIAIVGFEGYDIGQQYQPQLSTIKVNPFAMAEAAIERLIAQASSDDLTPRVHYIDCVLQPRQSTGLQSEKIASPSKEEQAKLTKAYFSTHENLSSDLAELISLNSELGHFMSWAGIARWQHDTPKQPYLKLIEVHGDYSPLRPETLAQHGQCLASEFPLSQWTTPYIKGAVQTLTLPLTVNQEPWGVLCFAGSISSTKQLNDYQQFVSMTLALSKKIERHALELLLTEQVKRSEQLQRQQCTDNHQENQGMWEWDLAKDSICWNERALQLLGLNEEKNGQVSLFDCIYENDKSIVERRLRQHIRLDVPFCVHFRVQQADHSLRWLQATGQVLSGFEGKPKLMMGTLQDSTEKRRSKHQFRMRANQDPLTGLPGRTSVTEQLTRQIEGSPQQMLAVFQIGLDRFKHLNSRYNHDVGDKLLNHIATALKKSLREYDFFARFNGDEFICLSPVDHPRQAMAMAERLRSQVEQPLLHAIGADFFVTASIGVAMYPEHAHSANELLRRADIAMHKAKQNGKNQVALYQSAVEGDCHTRAQMDNELRKAIAHNELTLMYQPQHDSQTDELLGVEALLRWNNKALGSISPVEFIPLAEENGQIVELGYWVLRQACATLRHWQQRYGTQITMSVNVSAGQLSHPAFLKNAYQIIQSSGICPSRLIMEITESTAISDMDNVRAILTELTSLGIQVSLDDFGTGFSSISLLRELPLNSLKIDRSFFTHLERDSQNWHIIQAIQTLGSALGYKIVAEGVETQAQLELVRELECDLVQGYVFNRPLSQTALESGYFQINNQDMPCIA